MSGDQRVEPIPAAAVAPRVGDLPPRLSDGVAPMRERSRIGSAGRLRADSHDSEAAAELAGGAWRR